MLPGNLTNISSLFLLLLCATCRDSCAFTSLSYFGKSRFALQQSAGIVNEEHPAVLGWPAKYEEAGGNISTEKSGPRIISPEFEVHKATDEELVELDVKHWPVWTTSDKEKWNVGNQVIDKEMPYGELSYMLSGKLEIIPQSTNKPVIVNVGDFVTFPKGFIASWKVLEELTWHYYLY